MPWPRLPGSGIEKILFSEKFFGEAVPNFFRFRMESGDKGLCLLGGTDGPLSLDGDDRRIARGCLSDSCCLVWTKSSDVSFLVAAEAESTLDPLSFFFVRERGPGSGAPYVHGVRVAVIEGVPPLRFCSSCSSVVPSDPFFEEYVLLLVFLR